MHVRSQPNLVTNVKVVKVEIHNGPAAGGWKPMSPNDKVADGCPAQVPWGYYEVRELSPTLARCPG